VALKQQIQFALSQVHDQESFFNNLLGQTLGWPLEDVREIEDIAYAWSETDLHAVDLERRVVERRAWQIQPVSKTSPGVSSSWNSRSRMRLERTEAWREPCAKC
jgi:hypothetical protein